MQVDCQVRVCRLPEKPSQLNQLTGAVLLFILTAEATLRR
ncbi:Hypothetical protein (plasmid) [Pseudomonas putida]|nr:Hypothetical protein [Pseudomonas putida]